MNENDILKAKALMDDREVITRQLRHSNQIDSITASYRWEFGCNHSEHLTVMVNTMKDCKQVCETMMVSRMKQCLIDIDKQLAKLGVEKDDKLTGQSSQAAD